MAKKNLRVGTRGSELALTQTQMVLDILSQKGHSAEKSIVKTRGDQDQRPFTQITGDGFFTKELEIGLLNEEYEIAVHSSKDLPSMVHENLPWKAFSHREDTRDILISRTADFDSLSDYSNIKVGTSSPRREIQIKRKFLGVQVEQLRGNVPTRIQKLVDGKYDAIVLAKAGVLRLGLLEKIKSQGLFVQDLDFVTAPCQGIIGIQSTSQNLQLLNEISDQELDQIAKAEKSVLALLGGGCHLPLGTKVSKSKNGYVLDFFLGSRRECIDVQVEANDLGSLLRKLISNLARSPSTEKRIWLAQPIQHALKPAAMVSRQNLQPVVWPLLEVVPSWKEKDILDFVNEKDRFGAVSFSSQFAVQIFMTQLEPYLDLKSWLSQVRIFAIGPSTKSKLSEYGITEVELSQEAHGKSLAALLEKARVRGDVLIPGQQGSLVKGRLKGFGPHTKGLTLYRMRSSQNPLSLNVPAVQANDHIVLTSPSAAKEFVIRCLKNPELKKLKVWAFGPSTSRELEFLGVQHQTNSIAGSWERILTQIKDI